MKVIDFVKRNIMLIVFGCVMFIFFIRLPMRQDDLKMFYPVLTGQGMGNFLVIRYTEWSSRLVVEFFAAIIVQSMFFWALATSFLCCLLLYSISQFTQKKESRYIAILIGLFMLYPIQDMGTAGWIATTTNYLWVLAFGLFALIPIKKLFYNEPIKKYMYILYAGAILYGANQEQMCALLFGAYVLACIYTMYVKKANVFIYIQTGISLISMIFHLTCPGNELRKQQEIVERFPDFVNMSFLRKLEMGFSSSLYEFIMEPNFIFFIFCISVLLLVLNRKENNKIFVIIGAFPLVINSAFGMFSDLFGQYFSGITVVQSALLETGTNITLTSPTSWIPDMIIGMVIICIVISVFYGMHSKENALVVNVIFIAGICTRIIMGFSPTIWASDTRTYIFMYFAIITCIYMIYIELFEHATKKYYLGIDSYLVFLGIISLINLAYTT